MSVTSVMLAMRFDVFVQWGKTWSLKAMDYPQAIDHYLTTLD